MSAETQAIIVDIKSALIKAHALDGSPDPYAALTTAQADLVTAQNALAAANTALTQAQSDLATRTQERDKAETAIAAAHAAAAQEKATDDAHVGGKAVSEALAAAGFPTP